MGKILEIGRHIQGTKTFCFVVTGLVPPGMKESDVPGFLFNGISQSFAVGSHVKACSITLSEEAPDQLAQRLTGVVGKSLGD